MSNWNDDEIVEGELINMPSPGSGIAIVPVDTPARDALLQQAAETFIAGLAPNTQRAYQSRLDAFLIWRQEQKNGPLVVHLKQYVAHLQHNKGLSARSVQAHINTIKGMLRTAAAIEPTLANGLPQLELVKPPRVRGSIYGHRLTQAEGKILLQGPGTETVKGLRDTAIIGLLITIGLRRSEICNLTWGHLQDIDGHKVIANLSGKHGRVRTVKIPVWLWRTIMDWGQFSDLDVNNPERRVFVPITKDGKVLLNRRGMTPHAIYKLINGYTAVTGLPPVKPHDLRRTAALLARRGGASIEQVQLMLGHASPQTTSNYIGEYLDLDDNAVDYNPLQV